MPGNRVTVNFSGFDSEEKIAAYIGDISIELDSEFKTGNDGSLKDILGYLINNKLI